MKKIGYLILLTVMISCSSTEKIGITETNIERVEVFQGHPGEQIQMVDGFENKLIEDLNNSKYSGPTKFMKTHRILIYHSNGAVDTVLTNGKVHQFNGWYLSNENLIKKYSQQQNR